MRKTFDRLLREKSRSLKGTGISGERREWGEILGRLDVKKKKSKWHGNSRGSVTGAIMSNWGSVSKCRSF